ncbi:hypothetical protein DITRI_Ditri10aG0081500 [Diplodiscus trichospermus]
MPHDLGDRQAKGRTFSSAGVLFWSSFLGLAVLLWETGTGVRDRGGKEDTKRCVEVYSKCGEERHSES